MTQNARRRTINSNGDIIDAPYGLSRWSRPKAYACAHEGCPHPATVTKPANAHTADSPSERVAKAHNCCGNHP